MCSSSLADSHGLAALRRVSQSHPLLILRDALGDDARLHLVGGTVRDCLSHLEPADLDVATPLDVRELVGRLSSKGLRVIETGIEHGTITVLCGERAIEVTRFRKPTARNKSEFSTTIEEDLAGRDFTINAIAYALDDDRVIDPWNGLGDLRAARLVPVGDPVARFKEDPHRLMRLIRFGASSGRSVAPEVEQSARELAPLLGGVALERIRDELTKIMMSPHSGNGLLAMRDLGQLGTVLPELLPSVGCAQNEFHIHDVFEHTAWVLERAAPMRTVRFAALFHDAGKPASLTVSPEGRRHFYKHEQISGEIAVEAMTRLRFGSDEIRSVALLVRLHMRPLECGPTGVRRLLRELDEHYEDWRLLKCADAPPLMEEGEFKERLANFDALVASELTRVSGSVREPLAIDGNDLVALGMRPSPALGRVLKALDDLRIEDPDRNTRTALLEHARRLIERSHER